MRGKRRTGLFVFAALALLPMAAHGQNETVIVSSGGPPMPMLTLPSVPGWYGADRGLQSSSDPAWMIGHVAYGQQIKTLQQWAEVWALPTDPDTRRLSNIHDALGRLYIVYAFVDKTGYWNHAAMAFADNGNGFIRLTLSAPDKETFDRNLPIFQQTVGRYAGMFRTSLAVLDLPPVPGWHWSGPAPHSKDDVLIRDGEPDVAKARAILGGTSVLKSERPDEINRYITMMPIEVAGDPEKSFTRLPDITDASGKKFLVTVFTAPNLWIASAQRESGGHYIKLTLYAHSREVYDESFGAFAYMVSHYAEKAP